MIRRLYIFCLLLLAVSCAPVTEPENFTHETAEVSLSISFDKVSFYSEAVEVKSPEEVEDVIKNLWIIQFDGVNDNAKLLGEPTYISDFQSFYADGADRMVKLLATEYQSSIIFLANTFEDKDAFQIPQGYTIAKMKERFRTLKTPDDFMGTDEQGNRYPIYNDFYKSDVEGITEGSDIKVELERNLAELDIVVTNNVDGLVLNSLQLCSIPDRSYYVTDFDDLMSPFPSLENLNLVDYPALECQQGSNTVSVSTYLPVNLRGISDMSVSELSKNQYAPYGATYLLVSGVYGDGIPVYYRFYLGENLTDDFNIHPNNHYKFSFSIDVIGDSESDSRVENHGLVDFTSTRYERANSYILNPAVINRRFRIPIEKIFAFWGSDRYVYYEDDAYLSLRKGDRKWKAFVIQSDFAFSDSDFRITKSGGTAPDDVYFEVEVGPDVKGNVIVAVGPDDGSDNISWSWHLWITDYDPYESLYWGEGVEKQYIYPVRNGSMHRYEGTFWTNNKSHYIMDRNLGWTSAPNEYPADNRGLLYYQFGRKDPLMFSTKIQTVSFDVADQDNGVLYSIAHPTVFIQDSHSDRNQGWTYGNKYNPIQFEPSLIWNDPTTVTGAQNEGKKSVFDPCPPGYRLPDRTIWSDFKYNKLADRTTNSFADGDYVKGTFYQDSDYKSGFDPYFQVKGLQYWPFQGEGVLVPEHDGLIYIPATGFIEPRGVLRSHGNANYDGSVDGSNEYWSFLWSEDPAGMTDGKGYTSQPNHLSSDNSTPRSRAFPVRCITDR